jgi:hypothetical protein
VFTPGIIDQFAPLLELDQSNALFVTVKNVPSNDMVGPVIKLADRVGVVVPVHDVPAFELM